jgi:hypothetical protein
MTSDGVRNLLRSTAGTWRDDYSQFLDGKNGNDKAGLEHAEQVARSLYGKAASVKICMLPPKTKDLSDWNAPPDEAARYIAMFSKPWSPDAGKESFLATFEHADRSLLSGLQRLAYSSLAIPAWSGAPPLPVLNRWSRKVKAYEPRAEVSSQLCRNQRTDAP